MAKDSASSRIPRLDGVSRIPLPGSLRPPSSTAQPVTGIAARTTQIFQRASSVGFPQKRPSTLAGLRPSPIVSANALKRSASGDHITNAMNLVTKKTTTAIKKWMSKPEKMPPPIALSKAQGSVQTKVKRKQALQQKASVAELAPDNSFNTPRPLTRSDTFVRTDSPNDITQFAPSVLTQSTPAPPTTIAFLATTRITLPPDINETTKLLSNNTRHTLYTTQSLDTCQSKPATQFGDTFEASMKRAMPLDDTNIDMTISLYNQHSPNATHAILKPNLTTTFNAPALLGQTMNVVSSAETFAFKTQVLPNDATQLNAANCMAGTNMIDSADAFSPITNATYSNPDSLDNLQLLEDVSAPSGFLEMDLTLQSDYVSEHEKTRDNLLECSICSDPDDLNSTLTAKAPEKAHMKLPLHSTVNTEKLVDLTANMPSPLNQRKHKLHLTKDYMESSRLGAENINRLLYMTQHQCSTTGQNTPDYKSVQKLHERSHILPTLQPPLKAAHSELVLPTRTPDDEPLSVPMEIDADVLLAMGSRTEKFFSARDNNQLQAVSSATSLQDVNNLHSKQKSRYSFGLDLTESTLDCSIELVDVSLSSSAAPHPTANSSMVAHLQSPSTHSQTQQQQQHLRRQTSFELDESLGILTPDQMKEFLDSTNTNNTNHLELPLAHTGNKMSIHHMRIDQTPSPEELPLDPVEVKTDVTELSLSHKNHQPNIFESSINLQNQQQMRQQQSQQQQQLQSSSISTAEPTSTHTDTDISCKTSDAMTKSNVSKISTSFITSVTSVTSLDTGYQGDGEMSRPASRGASDHSPSNGPAARKGGHVSRQPSFNQQLQQQQMPLVRRQDPMTDSDFFTESDADDIFHRGDRRAQVIDGQLYGPMLQPAASVFISEDPEDSCMESSGIFTDIENRCDDDLAQMRRQDTQDAMLDMSPEGDGDDSTETVKSNREAIKNANNTDRQANKSEMHAGGDVVVVTAARTVAATTLGQGQLSSSQTSTIHSSMSTDRLSAATLFNRTSYCSVDGNTVNVDSKSFSSLEEAFGESALPHINTDTSHNSAEHGGMRTPLSMTGNDACGVDKRFGVDSQTNVGTQQHVPVQRVNPSYKHASLTSLTTVAASSAAFSDSGAKLENTCIGLSVTRGRILIERETHSESGTAGTKVAGASSSASSSTTSLSVDNQSSNNNKSIQRHALEAAVAAAAVKATNIAGGGINRRMSPRTSSKFTSARNSPKQHASTGSVESVSDIIVVRKKQTPNKWEAVMHKIESNKALPKKNLKEVKSKVSTLRPNNGLGATGGADGNSATNGVLSGRSNISASQVRTSSATSTPPIRPSPTSNIGSGTMSPRTNGLLLPLRPTDMVSQRSGGGSPTTTAQQVSKRLFQGIAAKR